MIPKIIHRTIQHDTNEVIEKCWERVQELHPDWELKTWYDEDEYPYLGKYLDQCVAGAFRADLIRIDVVYRFGGIYLDSDVFLLKPLDELLNYEFWNAGSESRSFGNIAFGGTPEHPAAKALIEKAIEKMPSMDATTNHRPISNDLSLAWGPYVHTEALYGREDVVRLPSVSFQPYTLIDDAPEIPLFRTRNDVKNRAGSKLTDESYGVHIMNWSWNPKLSWENRTKPEEPTVL